MHLFWCKKKEYNFYRPKWCGGAPKLTNMRNGNLWMSILPQPSMYICQILIWQLLLALEHTSLFVPLSVFQRVFAGTIFLIISNVQVWSLISWSLHPTIRQCILMNRLSHWTTAIHSIVQDTSDMHSAGDIRMIIKAGRCCSTSTSISDFNWIINPV